MHTEHGKYGAVMDQRGIGSNNRRQFYNENKQIILTLVGCFCCIGVLLTIILIPVSLKSVEHDEYAIRYDDLSKKLYPNVYLEGKYLFTPQTKMFKYSGLVQKMSIELPCLTSNGIAVQLYVDIQYQIQKNQVFNAFTAFGEESNIRNYLRLICRSSIRDSCADYSAKDYYENRLTIQNTLVERLMEDIRQSKALYNITLAVLASYDFPNDLQDAIKDKRSAENEIAIAENERDGAVTEANTELLTAEIEADKLNIEGDAEVISVLAEANLRSIAIQSIWINRQSVYNDIIYAMNMSFDEFVNQYLYSVILLNADDPITNI